MHNIASADQMKVNENVKETKKMQNSTKDFCLDNNWLNRTCNVFKIQVVNAMTESPKSQLQIVLIVDLTTSLS